MDVDFESQVNQRSNQERRDCEENEDEIVEEAFHDPFDLDEVEVAVVDLVDVDHFQLRFQVLEPQKRI